MLSIRFLRAHSRHKAYAALILELLSRLPMAVAIYFLTGPFPFHMNFMIYTAGAVLGATLGLVPYYVALEREHAHNVTPYLELTPVFLIIFAYLFKNEVLTSTQLISAVLVIVSGFLFSWDFAHSRFKAAVFMLLALASLLFALYQYCISQAEPYAGLLAVAICYYFGSGLIGAVLFLAWKDVRKTIIKTFVQTKGATVVLAFSTNILSLLALITLLLSFRRAPTLGHVAALSGTQPIFSFAFALPLAKYFPKHFSKIIFDHETLAKLALVLFIAFGIYLLASLKDAAQTQHRPRPQH